MLTKINSKKNNFMIEDNFFTIYKDLSIHSFTVNTEYLVDVLEYEGKYISVNVRKGDSLLGVYDEAEDNFLDILTENPLESELVNTIINSYRKKNE